MPTFEAEKSVIENGIGVVDLFAMVKLGGSKSEIRRLVEQGGASVNNNTISDIKQVLGVKDLDDSGEFILRAGKKKFMRVIFK